MKKRAVVILICMIFSSSITTITYEQTKPTEVSATSTIITTKVIRENTTWTKSKSPYVIRYPLLIESNATLHIEPGASVILNPDSMLVVKGRLIAIGKRDEPITVVYNSTRGRGEIIPLSYLSEGKEKCGSIQIEHSIVSGLKVGSDGSRYPPPIARVTVVKNSSIENSILAVGNLEHSFINNSRIYSYETAHNIILKSDIGYGWAFLNNNLVLYSSGDGAFVVNSSNIVAFSKNYRVSGTRNKIVGSMYPQSKTSLHNNDIYGNFHVDVGLMEQFDPIVANLSHNYWGTNNLTVIRERIKTSRPVEDKQIVLEPIQTKPLEERDTEFARFFNFMMTWLKKVDPELRDTLFEVVSPTTKTRTHIVSWDGKGYVVAIESNSSISNFNFDQRNKQISYMVEGASGTMASSNITIPKELMRGTFTVLLDDKPMTFKLRENSTHTSLYFTYQHASRTVRIVATHVIPEFPFPVIILAVALTLSLLLTGSARRRSS